MQHGLQNNYSMENNFSNLLQALSRMSYFCKGEDVDPMERDQDCTHRVCDLIMISGLSHLDERVQGKADYPKDPYTRSVEMNCPKCGY